MAENTGEPIGSEDSGTNGTATDDGPTEAYRRPRIAALLPMLGFVVAGPALIVGIASSAAVVAARRRPELVSRSGGVIPTWTVRLVLLALLVLAGDALAGDVTEIL